MDILEFYHELLALIKDNDCEGLKAAKFNRTPGILYKPIEFEFTLDNESYTLEAVSYTHLTLPTILRV